jgi:phosphomannomutase
MILAQKLSPVLVVARKDGHVGCEQEKSCYDAPRLQRVHLCVDLAPFRPCRMGVDRLDNPGKTMITADSGEKSALIDSVHFGTDGWRAIIGEDFNPQTVARVADAAARMFRQRNPHETEAPNTIVIGYDCRLNAGRYAALVATVVVSHGFDAVVSDRYCPTPALCWTIAHDPRAAGGIMLTSSHNPAEYLGIKLRMEDGGASPKSFTDEVEAALLDEPPACFDEAYARFNAAQNGTPDQPATSLATTSADTPHLQLADIMTPYLEALAASVDQQTIKSAALRVVIDPLFGAGRVYLATMLRRFGVEVAEVNGETDPTFNGLHPEPILPWVKVGAEKVVELGYDACFVTDGDADRIGAIDSTGAYVTSHRVLALLIGHLVEDRGQTGRVVRTQAGSNLLRRQCDRLGLTLTTKPIGFKWIYEEMLKGDVLIGGEESGGIGIPSHVRERDGLLMALMLTELMAQKGKKLRELVDELLAALGTLEYARRDLRLTPEQKDALVAAHIQSDAIPSDVYRSLFTPLDEELVSVERGDGIKFDLASDAWLLVRPSGTEPLVRVYAEAATTAQVEALLDIGCTLAQGDRS